MARSTKSRAIPITKAKAITDPIGVSGLKRWGNRGMIWEEFLPELRGLRGVKKYKEMWDNDDTIGAVVYIVSVVLRGVKWDVQGENEEDVAFLNSCLEDMRPGWSNFIAEVLSMIVYGWSWHEIVYKRRAGENTDESRSSKFSDGKIGWARWDIRSQDSLNEWVWDPAGNLIAMAQQCPPDYRVREIPLSRSLLFRPTSYKNSPEGRSLLRSAYTAWYYKRNIENFRAIGIERDLTGLPVCRMEGTLAAEIIPGTSETVHQRMQSIMRSIKNDEQASLIIPLALDENGNDRLKFELMASPGQKTFDVNAAIQQYSAKIATCLCADFLQLGHEKVGSLALSSDKTDMFALSLKAILDAIAEPINDYAIPRLLRLNGRSTENLPRISYGDIETPDLNALGSYMERINATGMPLWPNRALEDRLLTSANLPLPTEDERAEQAMGAADPDVPTPSDEPVKKGNPYHKPAGSSDGGQFTSGPDSSGEASRDVPAEFSEIVAKDQYEYYGLRVVSSDRALTVGQTAPKSYRWDDDQQTDEELDGTSSILYRGGRFPKQINRYGFGDGDQLQLLGSNDSFGGSDPGEIVLGRAKVLATAPWKQSI